MTKGYEGICMKGIKKCGVVLCLVCLAPFAAADEKPAQEPLVTASIKLPPEQSYLQTQQSVLSSLEVEKLPVYAMTVTHFQGEVTLSGYVDTVAEAKKAAQVALKTPGVIKVNNYLVPRYRY